MKTLFRNYLLLLFCTSSFAQLISEKRIRTNEIPKRIEQTVNEKYPKAKSKFYKLITKDSTYYEVRLKKDKEVLLLVFNEEYVLLKSNRLIDFNRITRDIRKKIHKDLDSRFTRYRIISCEKHNVHNSIFYEVKIIAREKSLKRKMLFLYNSEGGFESYKALDNKPLSPIFH